MKRFPVFLVLEDGRNDVVKNKSARFLIFHVSSCFLVSFAYLAQVRDIFSQGTLGWVLPSFLAELCTCSFYNYVSTYIECSVLCSGYQTGSQQRRQVSKPRQCHFLFLAQVLERPILKLETLVWETSTQVLRTLN